MPHPRIHLKRPPVVLLVAAVAILLLLVGADHALAAAAPAGPPSGGADPWANVTHNVNQKGGDLLKAGFTLVSGFAVLLLLGARRYAGIVAFICLAAISATFVLKGTTTGNTLSGLVLGLFN
jgi:hypothetical protein